MTIRPSGFLLACTLPFFLISMGNTARAGWSVGGIEVNPFRVIDASSPLATLDDSRTLTLFGGIHFIDESGRSEIAVPLAWLSSQSREDVRTEDLLLFRTDVQYRRFLIGRDHAGLFAGPLIRFAHVASHNRRDGSGHDADRFGAGVVIGFRKLLRGNFWWGMTATRGRFFGGIPDMNDDVTFIDPAGRGESTVDSFTEIEVLTFGRRF